MPEYPKSIKISLFFFILIKNVKITLDLLKLLLKNGLIILDFLVLIDNITKVDFSIALINNILEIYKNINTDNQTFTNIEGSRNNVQTIIKLNKLILLVKNEDPKELLKLIFIIIYQTL